MVGEAGINVAARGGAERHFMDGARMFEDGERSQVCFFRFLERAQISTEVADLNLAGTDELVRTSAAGDPGMRRARSR